MLLCFLPCLLVINLNFIRGCTRTITTNLCFFLVYQVNIFPFIFCFVNYTVVFKSKGERKDIELVEEEQARIGADPSSVTSNKSENYKEEAWKKTQKHKPKRVESVNADAEAFAEAVEHTNKRDTGHQNVALDNKTGDSTMLKMGDSAKVVIKQDMKGRRHKYGFNNNEREKAQKKRVVDDETADKHQLDERGTSNNLKVVYSGTKEFKIASNKRDLFLGFSEHQERLRKKFALEEGRIFAANEQIMGSPPASTTHPPPPPSPPPPSPPSPPPPPPTSDASASTSAVKRTRKASRLRLLSTRPPGVERPVVHVDPATGKADGPHKKKLRTYLGIVARDKVDITYENWKEVPTAQKDLIWEDIQAEFDILEASDSRTKRKLLQTALAANQDGVEDTVCDKYGISKEKWAQFCQTRRDPSWEDVRMKAQAIQKQNTTPHVLSRGGYDYLEQKLLAEKTKKKMQEATQSGSVDGVIDPPSPVRRHVKWKMARTKKTGEMTTVATCPFAGERGRGLRPDPEVDDPLYLMTLTISELFLRPYQVRWDATVFGVVNPDFPLYIKHEDLSEIAHGGQCLSISVLQLWILHLTETCMRAGNSDIYGFLEPQSIQRFGQSQFESESYIKSWMQSSQRDVYLGAYLNGFHCSGHWQMVVILPKEHLVVWFCSLHNKPDNYLKGIINSAIKGLDDAPQPKSKAPARWIVVKCNRQKGTTECGYYVMHWMSTIILGSFRNNWEAYFNDPRPLEPERLKALRIQWAQFYLRVRDQA
ncbi:hypothetical protein HKD37_19G052914 [Glycine soja]